MKPKRKEIQWTERLSKQKLRCLYESDAKGLLDENLLNDVGITLFCRCQDILTVTEAKKGKIQCPRCARLGVDNIVMRPRIKGNKSAAVITCDKCGWSITWGEYAKTFKRKQMNIGGARSVFESYISTYKLARTAKQKLLAIDRLIHEFHYYYNKPDRPVGPNLIQGRLTDILAFFNELTYGPASTQELRQGRVEWESRSQKIQKEMVRRNRVT